MSPYRRLLAKVNDLCAVEQRTVPRLIAVTKGRSVADIKRLYQEGQREFGENYLDELGNKAQQLNDLKDLRWIFIGTLQSNKIKRLAAICVEIQTVASLKHARHLERFIVDSDKVASFPIYLAVNIGDEQQKSGVSLNKVPEIVNQIEENCPHLQLEGLMAIPPQQYTDDNYSELPPLYRQLAQTAQHCGAGKLSLGMSADLRLAIMAGSSCLRVGRDLFSPTANNP